MAQFSIDDLVVTAGGEKQAPKLAVRAGSRTLTLATFKSGEDADLVEEILAEVKKRLGSVPD